jgi:class 3 adenylate cyclase/pimeloyl-ACP methyl ester carboxylesterase
MRGIGLSDRGREPPMLERQMGDIGAVMDAAGSKSAAVIGGARGAAMSLLFAATYPERVRALILYAPLAKTVRSSDWPYGRTEAEQQHFFERFAREMGTGENLDLQGPSYDERFKKWWARFERLGASPGAWREIAEILAYVDVRQVLPHIQAPTLVLHRTGDRISDVAQSRAVAELIPGARFVELPGEDHIPFLGDHEAITSEVEEFLTGARHAPETERVLATVLFTDIVGASERAATLGDRAWTQLLEEHHLAVRRELDVYRGTEIDTAGDGFMAAFDGPARAIRCAQAIVASLRALGIEIRAGLHTGECERVDTKLAGIAVHIAARVAASGGAGQVRLSSTVKDLVAGSGIRFTDLGVQALKGIPDRWHLYMVDS